MFDTTNPIRWGGRQNLSPRLASELVIKVSERLNLDEVQTFDLLESYFSTNESTRKLLDYIFSTDQMITEAEQALPQNINMLQNMQIIQQRLKNIEKYKSEFSLAVNQALNES